MNITIPELSLVVLIGPAGSGKSTFAGKFFRVTQVISSDFCRGLVCDDEADQTATQAAFAVLHTIASKRLAAGKLTVIDATSVKMEARRSLLSLAQRYDVPAIAIIFRLPLQVCLEQNLKRVRSVNPEAIREQYKLLQESLPLIPQEGFYRIYLLRSVTDLDQATVVIEPMSSNRKNDRGPFDIIGDIHGCFDELVKLLEKLNYKIHFTDSHYAVSHPDQRKLVFLGDLVDRGPRIPEVVRLVRDLVKAGNAYCVMGNHDWKLYRKWLGRNVRIGHGLAQSLEQYAKQSPEIQQEAKEFIGQLQSHYLLDEGNLCVAHAGMKEQFQGRFSKRVFEFALYGETTGEMDQYGLPVRVDWAVDYQGKALVVYGHTALEEPQWLNNTVNIDTGCVYGGKLTALRYPEREIVSVPAQKKYYEPRRPIFPGHSP